jgi:hypothetical protein
MYILIKKVQNSQQMKTVFEKEMLITLI